MCQNNHLSLLGLAGERDDAFEGRESVCKNNKQSL